MKAKPLYVGLRVKDLQKSIDFYRDVLGMKYTGSSKITSTHGEVAGLEGGGGFTLELNYYDKDSPYYSDYNVGEGLDHLAFLVEDLDAALEEANSKGYRTVAEVKGEKNRWAYIEDPNGIWIELCT